MNLVLLTGNVGSQPEIKQIGENKVASFSLATNESYKNKQGEKVTKTEWHRLEYWGKTADIIERFINKGDLIEIHGSIRYEEYEKDGEKKFITKIRGEKIGFLSSKKTDQNTPDVVDNSELPF